MKISLLTRAYWTKNRLSILLPWMTPLVLSCGIGFFNIPLAFMSFLILSGVARIVVVKRSPFAGLFKEDFEERLKEKEITLKNGTVLQTRDIKKTKRFLGISKVISLVFSFIPMIFFKDLPDVLLGWLFLFTWFFLSQAFFKIYLIAKDLPLNWFPFFRSKNTGRSSSDSKISIGVMDNPMNPLYPTNIGNPANPNYIFK